MSTEGTCTKKDVISALSNKYSKVTANCKTCVKDCNRLEKGNDYCTTFCLRTDDTNNNMKKDRKRWWKSPKVPPLYPTPDHHCPRVWCVVARKTSHFSRPKMHCVNTWCHFLASLVGRSMINNNKRHYFVISGCVRIDAKFWRINALVIFFWPRVTKSDIALIRTPTEVANKKVALSRLGWTAYENVDKVL